ncbi:MAG: P1 family peptidase [Firmicutes bacterium]|nr:P1 family peptidase [Bacillota bacterium]
MLKDFKIGNYTDAENGTGATVIICEKGAVGGVSVKGASPATRETDLLKSEKTVEMLNAVVLSGGSAFGLEASSGVTKYLSEIGAGFKAGKFIVPIVSGASLFDLEFKNFAYPNVQNGYDTAKNAVSGNFEFGNIGAGTGATISKVLGAETSAKGGLGVKTFKLNNLEIAVFVAVNAVGDIVKNGEILSGAKHENGEFLDSSKVFTLGATAVTPSNTTIGAIITNAKLTKVQANILAELSHNGLALSLSPCHTAFDGDAMFVMASGETDFEFNALTALIPNLVAEAIQSVALQAETHTQKRVNPVVLKLFKKVFAKAKK